MMGPMQSGLNFTDRIVKYVAKWAERKTKPASPSRGHVILSLVFNQMCDDAEFALETHLFCLLPIPHTHTPLEPYVK